MHGRPRKALDGENLEALAAKAEKLRSLQSQFLANHQNRIYSKEALELNAKLLETNPELYTAWNYRKLAIQHYLSQSESDPVAVKSLLDEELKVVENALKKNFKSYGAWHHRKWVLSKGHSSVDNELRLLQRFQKADPRNFHAWNYRRFVAALMKKSDEDELNYTDEMIGENFSNYSAWHNRSIILSNLLKRKGEGYFSKEEALVEEYKLVLNALYTDQDDQSGWFYHLWLINQTLTDAPLLLSSWPSHGSNITLQGSQCLHSCSLSQLNSMQSDAGTVPVILYFNQAVEGINSSTVAVESELDINRGLVWKPLSTYNSKAARVWVTFLSLGNIELQPSKAYPVDICIGHSQGIVSSSGDQYSLPSQITFKLCVQNVHIELDEATGNKIISWKDENFQRLEHSRELESILPVDQLTTQADHITSTSHWRIETIANEIEVIREFLSEIDCKIGKLALARLLNAHDSLSSLQAKPMVHAEEVLKLYSDLMKLDVMHYMYYKDEHSQILLQQIVSTRESVLPYCHHYRDSMGTIVGYVCLQLQNLSLSRIASIENLLWVQMLDLSHNELQSIEGLEALQLLSCLNLSHNKLSSFTALGPLRLLKSLKVLNISYNEIGLHSVDTTRYLSSSPLTHSEEFAWDHSEILTSGITTTYFWEPLLIFKSLNLTQLDMVGNAIADENFSSFIVKVVPTLKWLDGASTSKRVLLSWSTDQALMASNQFQFLCGVRAAPKSRKGRKIVKESCHDVSSDILKQAAGKYLWGEQPQSFLVIFAGFR